MILPTLREIKADKRFTVLAAVWILLLYNTLSSGDLNSLAAALAVVVFTAVIDVAFVYLLNRSTYQFELPLSALVSGSIISAVVTPSFASLHVPLIAAVFAIGCKQLMRSGGQHIFNPANFGILAVTALSFFHLLPALQTWWAATPWWLVLPLALVVVYRINGWVAALPFLAGSALLVLISGSAASYAAIYAPFISGTSLFFAGIMLVEPMTSPRGLKAKTIYGALAALLAFVFSFYLPDFWYVGALALANLAAKPLDKYAQG